jgi:hypothetical protein
VPTAYLEINGQRQASAAIKGLDVARLLILAMLCARPTASAKDLTRRQRIYRIFHAGHSGQWLIASSAHAVDFPA